MCKEIEVRGCIKIPPETTLDEAAEAFWELIRANGWSFEGVIREQIEEEEYAPVSEEVKNRLRLRR